MLPLKNVNKQKIDWIYDETFQIFGDCTYSTVKNAVGQVGRTKRKAARLRGSQTSGNKRVEIKSIGPICLTWSEVDVKHLRGKTVKKYRLNDESDFGIWVEWPQGYDQQWTAEKQQKLNDLGLGEEVQNVLKSKSV